MRRVFGFLLAAAWCVGAQPASVSACDQCGCSFNAGPSHGTSTAGSMITTPTAGMLGRGRGSVGFQFETQRFNSIPAAYAHELHHNGHDVHGTIHDRLMHMTPVAPPCSGYECDRPLRNVHK